MKKILILTALFLLFVSGIYSQVNIVKSSISTAGGSATTGDITVIAAIGEVAAQEKTQGNILLSEGFIAPDFYDYLGIEDFEPLPGITLFPNPASDIINLTLPYNGNFDVRIFDITQKEMNIEKPEGTREMQLKVRDFIPGTYILFVIDHKNKKSSAIKFVKL